MVTWNGPGHWRSYANRVQPGYSDPAYDPAGAPVAGSTMTTASQPSTLPGACGCCDGQRSHPLGECTRCDGTGEESSADGSTPLPCEGVLGGTPGQPQECPECGNPIEWDPHEGWQHHSSFWNQARPDHGSVDDALRAMAKKTL